MLVGDFNFAPGPTQPPPTTTRSPSRWMTSSSSAAALPVSPLGSSLLRTLLRSDVRSVEAMIMADKTNQKSLSKLHYEAGPAHVIAQIEALLRQLHAKAVLNVPDPLRSARLFAALIKGSDLLIIARFDEARAEDDNEIESYCRSAVAMFIAAHGGNDHAGG